MFGCQFGATHLAPFHVRNARAHEAPERGKWRLLPSISRTLAHIIFRIRAGKKVMRSSTRPTVVPTRELPYAGGIFGLFGSIGSMFSGLMLVESLAVEVPAGRSAWVVPAS